MQYAKELEFAKQLARKAGRIMVKNFSHSTITVKQNITPVTETDFEISKLVIDEVKNNFPLHVVLDEELQHDNHDADYVWICDPVDGTIPFSHHIPTSMFSLALCHKGEPIVAVIYDPYMKRLLHTVTDQPSYMNDNEIHVKKDGFEAGDIVYGIPYWNDKFDTNKYIELMFSKQIRVSYIESIVYQGMLVALGLTRAMVTIAASPWDRAAAMLIVENAGGICTDEHGDKLTVFGNPKLFVATNGSVHKEILDVVHRCF